MTRLLRGAVGVALAASAVSCSSGDATASSVEIGRPAPAYHAVSLAGDSVSLATYRGKVVLLNVWATWCGPCRKEIPELRAIDSRFRGQGLQLIGVTVDADGMQPQIADFVKEFQMTYVIWHDPGERVSAQFLILGLPATYLIDRNGILRWKTMGPVAPGDASLDAAIKRALQS